MNIRAEIRTVEDYVKDQTDSKAKRVEIISRAQGMVTGDERVLAVLAIAKRRIIAEYIKTLHNTKG